MKFAVQSMAIRDAINSAMADEMERDERVFLIGNFTKDFNKLLFFFYRRGSRIILRCL